MLTALGSQNIKSADDSSLVSNRFRPGQNTEVSSIPSFSHPPTISQTSRAPSEPLQRYLEDTTVLVPEYSHSCTSSEDTGRTEVEARKRMLAYLKDFNM